MKNLSKLLLLGILAGGGYLLSMVVYGADCPNIFGGYICSSSTNDVCNNPGGTCLCNGVTINDGVTCTSSVDPTADGSPTTITNGNICGDADGCICGGSTITNGSTCTIVSSDITAPTLIGGTISIVNNTARYPFTCSEGNVRITCLGSCGSCSLTANTGNNTVSFTLANGTYSNCSIIGQDSAGNISSTLSIPSFNINYTAPTGGGGGGGGGTSICSDLYLTCTNGIYTLKQGYYCVGGNLGKTCTVSLGTGVEDLLLYVKEKKSTLYEYKPQGIAVRIYVPNYRLYLIKKTILSLNYSVYKAINKKLLGLTDPSYMIENFEDLGPDMETVVYKEIGSLIKLYNDFLGLLYIVLDMGKKEYLPIARQYFTQFFTDFANFKK